MDSAATGPQSVERALELLDVIASSSRPVTAKFLARRFDCALSTVYNLLGPLTARGHVSRTADGYLLGSQVLTLHRAFQRTLPLDSGRRELLFRIRAAVGADTYLSAYRDGEIAVLDSTVAPRADTDPFPVGPDSTAHATAHGKVLLASVSRRLRRRYLQTHGMPRLTGNTITDPERFESEATGVRRRGIAVSVGECDSDFTCLAVPVPSTADDSAEQVVQALSVSLPTADYQRQHRRISDVLTRTTDQFS
ncbi:IclR family transcriptional regulator [Streptomyces aculeolatus]